MRAGSTSSTGLLAATAIAPMAWGTTYAVTTELLPADRPLLAGALRAAPAGLLLLAVTRQLPRGSWWWRASILGTLNIGAFFALVQEKVKDRDPDAWVAELQAMKIIAARAYRIAELRTSRHLAARGYWRRAVVGGEEVVLPGPAFRLTETPAREPQGKADAAA